MANLFPPEVQAYLSAYKYKLELHAHTSPVSPCSELTPAEVVTRLHAQGYHGVVITNHFCSGGKFMKTDDPVGTYLADYYAAKEAGEAVGMQVLLGAEYCFNENPNDYLVFGADEALLRETVSRFDLTFDQFYEEYHSENLLIMQAHPFRNGLVRANPAHLDGVETFNMHLHHNSRVAEAARWAKENKVDIMTVGTDLHNPGYEGLCATRTRVLPKTPAELIASLREHDYLMEIAGCPLLPYASF